MITSQMKIPTHFFFPQLTKKNFDFSKSTSPYSIITKVLNML